MGKLLDLNLKAENLNQNKIEIQKQVKQEYKLIGSMSYQKGHTLFEYNVKTKSIKKATYKMIEDTIQFNSIPLQKRELVIKQDCYYLQALNMNNALKKLRKIGFDI